MRAVLQRVSTCSVTVDGSIVGSIGQGWLVFVGVAKGDTDVDADRLAEKTISLRAFGDTNGKMNLSVVDIGGAILVVSQFTLMGDCRAGRRPSFIEAAEPAEAERLYLRYVLDIASQGVPVQTGIFRADMKVELVNDGPVTLLIDSTKRF